MPRANTSMRFGPQQEMAGDEVKIPPSDFLSSFEIGIQFGAILSVVALYFRKFFNLEILKRVFVAFVPTAVVGFFLYKLIKHVFMNSTTLVLWSLFLGGIFLIVFERLHRGTNEGAGVEKLSYKQCFLIGVFQSISVVPGVSRSAATIIGGLLLGVSRTVIVEFSFLLAVPTMLAATGYDLLKNGFYFSQAQIGIFAVGFVTSFIVAILAIKFLLRFVQTHNFTVFGVYRVLLAALLFFIL